MTDWMRRFRQAQQLKAPATRVLFGFSRLIDAKATLNPRFIEAASRDRRVNGRALERLVDRGPGKSGGWGLIDTPEKLLAAMVRHQVVGEGMSLQLQITPQVSSWLGSVLQQSKTPVRRAVGGASAFGANLAGALPGGPRVLFHSAQPISLEQAGRFSARVKVVTPTSVPRGLPARRAADPASPTTLLHARYRNDPFSGAALRPAVR